MVDKVNLTTHVLDTARGLPAAGIPIALYWVGGEERRMVARAETNGEGRTAAPLATQIEPGTYELIFSVAAYFESLRTRALFEEIAVRVRLVAGEHHYHIPLLLAPWSYSTYRGS